MWNALQSAWDTVFSRLKFLFEEIGPQDIFDVIIVAFLIYEVIILVRHTRAQQLATGIFILLLSYAIASAAELRTLTFVLGAVMQFGIIMLAVVFQPELRRALEQVGGVNSALSKIFRSNKQDEGTRAAWEKAIVAVCDAAENMAEERTGALVVMERNSNLTEIIRTGTAMHADVNVEALMTIFYEGTPLHDGAVVIRNGRIEAAGCFLPLSNNLELSKDMGTRHRSALGMSENSDAVIVVVSEENGIISLAKNGVLIRRLDRQNLFNLLISEIIPPQPEKEKKGLFGRRKKKEAADAQKD